MTSERSSVAIRAAHHGRSWRARALLAAASFAALAGCSVRQEAADAQNEATASTVAALDDTWTEFATLPRIQHAAVELGAGRALVCGGFCRGGSSPCGGPDSAHVPLPNCELFEAQGNQVTSTVFHLPGDPPGRLNATLTRLPTGGVLVAGGRDGHVGGNVPVDSTVASTPIADWLQAGDNPGLNWLSPAHLNVARETHTATLLGTSVVAIGGWNQDSNVQMVGKIEVLTNAVNASWNVFSTGTPPQPALEPRSSHTATLLKPAGSEARVLILGGFDTARGVLSSGFIFSLEHGIQSITPMPAPGRFGHTATLLDDDHGSVLVVGGHGADSTSAFADAWRYDPVTDSWSPAGAGSGVQPVQRRDHAAVLLGGYVIVAGGHGQGTTGAGGNSDGLSLQSVQSYDWRHDSWGDLPPLARGRWYLQLLRLSDTQIVASGGETSAGDFPATSELITLSPPGPLRGAGCASGHQTDGVCCESACDGPCQACDEAGVCQPLTGTPHSGHPSCGGNLLCSNGECPAECDSTKPCVAGFFCDGGQCRAQKLVGEGCGTSAACANGAPCVDGVCCRSECSGACETCNAGTGLCVALPKGTAPLPSHPSCSTVSHGDPQCDAICDGVIRDRCVFPGADSVCSSASCEDDTLQSRRACNGRGACQAVATEQSCAPFACDASSVGGDAQCKRSCVRQEDCSSDAHCDKATEKCARCDENQCQGFRCDLKADECLRTCQTSATDCRGGYYCHPLEHRCVASANFPASALPACTMGMSRRGYHSFAIAAAAWLLLAARRRRFKRSARGSLC